MFCLPESGRQRRHVGEEHAEDGACDERYEDEQLLAVDLTLALRRACKLASR